MMTKKAGRLTGRITDVLREDILSGTLAPGERIRQEELSANYGVSRLPIRDALKTLEAEGLVLLIPNTGAWVAKLSREEYQEVYQVRERVEPLLLRMSMQEMDEGTKAKLMPMVEEMRETEDRNRFLALDREFHMLTYSSARSTMLGDLVERMWNTTQHYRRAFSIAADDDYAMRTTHLEHELLVLAILRNDADKAEQVLAGHIRSTMDQLRRHPEVFHDDQPEA